MAGDSKKLQPIIIKRIKKAGHTAHGGAWKIAYADFVTAMMAFFLLMWLLGSTTDGDRKGISDYCSSPLKVGMFGGTGASDASSLVKGGGQDLTRQTGQVKAGEVESQRKTINLKALKEEQRHAERNRLKEMQKKIEKMLASNASLAALGGQIKLDMAAEGLRIQIIDQDKRPMFDSGSAAVKPYMRELLQDLGDVLSEVPNRLTIEGHTDAQAFPGNQRGYSNWELSADRANASRREMVAGGLPDARVLRVQGLAASKLLDPADPNSQLNRRISIIVMNRDAEDAVLKNLPDDEESSQPEAASAATISASAPKP